MRRSLVDHARSRGAAKRAAPATVLLDDVSVAAASVEADVLALYAAMEKLARIDQRQSRLVEFRFSPG